MIKSKSRNFGTENEYYEHNETLVSILKYIICDAGSVLGASQKESVFIES